MKRKCQNLYKGHCTLKAYPNVKWGILMYPLCCMVEECMAWSEDYDYCKLIGFIAEIPK